MPTIAIVDSGIDKNRADFDGGGVVVDQVITQLLPSCLATVAGTARSWPGSQPAVAPTTAARPLGVKLVSLDVMDDNGMARTSDVIAAAQWIYEHKDQYNIRVGELRRTRRVRATSPGIRSTRRSRSSGSAA